MASVHDFIQEPGKAAATPAAMIGPLQLVRLRSSDHDASASSEISGRIRVLMSEIETRVEAAAEVRRLTASD